MEHDEPMDVAQAKLEAGIAEAMSRFGSWVGRVDWSDDRHSATIAGSGYEVRLWYRRAILPRPGTHPAGLEAVRRGRAAPHPQGDRAAALTGRSAPMRPAAPRRIMPSCEFGKATGQVRAEMIGERDEHAEDAGGTSSPAVRPS